MTPTPPPFTFPSCWNTLRCKRHWSEHARIWLLMRIAWENSQHLATLPLVSRTNDAWETSAEIPYWWHVTTQILLVLLIGCAAWEIWFNQSFGGEASGSVTKMLAVFSGYDEKKGKISISITFLVYSWSVKLDGMDNSNSMQHGLGKIYLHIKNKLRVEIRLGRSLHTVILTSIRIHKVTISYSHSTLQCAAKFCELTFTETCIQFIHCNWMSLH